MRRWVFRLALVLLAMTTTAGCGQSYPDRAQRLADQVYPGQLRLIDTTWDVGAPVPWPIRRAVFGFTQQPDAGLIIDALEPQTLRDAYASGLDLARRLTSVQQALTPQQLDVVGLRTAPDSTYAQVWITGEVDVATVASLQARLERSASAWAATTRPAAGTALRFMIIPTSAAAARPAEQSDWPAALWLNSKTNLDAIHARVSLQADVRTRPDGTVWVAMQPAIDYAGRQRLYDAWADRSGPWLSGRGLRAGRWFTDAERLSTGSLTELRLYRYVCPAGTAACETSNRVLGATVDLRTQQVSGLTLLDRPAGGWRLPLAG